MTLSFKDFTLQFLGLKLPVDARAVASSLYFIKSPISLQAVISSGEPYVPDVSSHQFVDSSGNSTPGPIVSFFWVDKANWQTSGGPTPNQKRQATSWNLTVWEAGGEPGGFVIDANVPFRNETSGLVQYNYVSIQLDGEYKCQVTAFNNYGSASVVKNNVAITIPGTTPSISVAYLGNNNFQVKGSGFTPGGQVLVIAQVGGYAVEAKVTADSMHGSIPSTPMPCQETCGQANGGQLNFTATDLATNTQSNKVSKICH
jgi:hypothetical protein